MNAERLKEIRSYLNYSSEVGMMRRVAQELLVELDWRGEAIRELRNDLIPHEAPDYVSDDCPERDAWMAKWKAETERLVNGE